MPRRLTIVVAAALALGGCAELRDFLSPPEARRADATSLAAVTPAAGASAAVAEATRTIEALAAEALAILGDEALAEPVRAERFQALLARAIDIPLIARFTLGAHWRAATPAQRSAYLAAFNDFILASYSHRIGGVTVTEFAVLGATASGDDVLVNSRIGRDGGAPIAAVWRLRRRDGAFRIIDVAVEGISLALTRRQEFAAVIRASGGDIDGLIARLRDHAA